MGLGRRISSINDLESHITGLFTNYNKEKHLGNMEKMSKYHMSEYQFAHLIGKLRMFNYLSKQNKVISSINRFTDK